MLQYFGFYETAPAASPDLDAGQPRALDAPRAPDVPETSRRTRVTVPVPCVGEPSETAARLGAPAHSASAS